MTNQLNDALVVLVGVVTVYYIWALCSSVFGVLTTIYIQFRQRDQQKQLAMQLEAMINRSKDDNSLN